MPCGDPRYGPCSVPWELWSQGQAPPLSGLICAMCGMNQRLLEVLLPDGCGLGRQSSRAGKKADHLSDVELSEPTPRYIPERSVTLCPQKGLPENSD